MPKAKLASKQNTKRAIAAMNRLRKSTGSYAKAWNEANYRTYGGYAFAGSLQSYLRSKGSASNGGDGERITVDMFQRIIEADRRLHG